MFIGWPVAIGAGTGASLESLLISLGVTSWYDAKDLT